MKALKNPRGQLVMEAVLLMLVFVSIMAIVSASLKNNQVVARTVQGPWRQMSGMFQNGVWGPQVATQPYHPNAHSRHISLKGDSAR